MTKDDARDLIEQFFADPTRSQLLELVDEVPLTSSDDIRTGDGTLIGSRAFERPLQPDAPPDAFTSLPTEFRTRGTPAAITSRWIKNHLVEVGEDYARRMWKRYQVFRIRRVPDGMLTDRGRVVPVQDAGSFRGRLSMLRQLGLIDYSGTTEPGTAGTERRYLEVIQPDSPLWDNPQGGQYEGTTPASFKEVVNELEDELGREPTLEEVADELGIQDQSAALRADAWGIELPQEAEG